jgi:glutathione synthase/RimK-type ligase-like ATP-grasp enzyme
VPVALVTSGEYLHLDDDLPLLVDALTSIGVDAIAADWHDDGFDWGTVDLAVLRSTWDYTTQLPAFLGRLEQIDAATTLANPLPVVRMNADKSYLLGLAEAGVPVVPTTLVRPGDDVELPAAGAFVVKPTVSAGARDTERYSADGLDAASAHARSLLDAGRPVLVQPYVAAIDETGETGMVYLGDEFSHGFRKGAILQPGSGFVDGLYREEAITPRTPSAAELAVAEQALDAVAMLVAGCDRRDLLYARVDVAPGPDGPLVMELELIEPSFFLPVADGSAGRAAEVIARASGAH